MGFGKMNVESKPRDESQTVRSLSEVAADAEKRARDADWNNHPAAARLRREADALANRLRAGELHEPLF